MTRNTPLLSLLLLSFTLGTYAQDLFTCSDDFIVLSEDAQLQVATETMVTNFIETCEDSGQCPYEIDEDLMMEANAVAANPDAASDLTEIPPIVGKVEVMTTDLLSDPTYDEYFSACLAARAKIQCADVKFVAKGLIEPLEDLVVDVEADGYSLPLCLPASCPVDDLTAVAETLVKEQIKASPDIQEALISQGIAMSTIDFFTVDLLCALSGLEKCEFTATPVSCSAGVSGAEEEGSSGGMSTTVSGIASFAMVVASLAVMQ